MWTTTRLVHCCVDTRPIDVELDTECNSNHCDLTPRKFSDCVRNENYISTRAAITLESERERERVTHFIINSAAGGDTNHCAASKAAQCRCKATCRWLGLWLLQSNPLAGKDTCIMMLALEASARRHNSPVSLCNQTTVPTTTTLTTPETSLRAIYEVICLCSHSQTLVKQCANMTMIPCTFWVWGRLDLTS